MAYATAGTQAGISTATSSAEAALLGGPSKFSLEGAVKLVAASVDAGNTPTTTLRPGLILGVVTASGLYTPYNPDATDGSETPVCILNTGMSMLGAAGAVEIKEADVLFGGVIQVSSGAIGGITGQDGALTAHARKVLGRQFIFDDEMPNKQIGWRQEQVATDTTVTAAKNGTLYIATAAATFTLPTIAYGLEYEFLMVANANMAITGAASTLIRATSNTYGTTATFSTANSLFGANAKVKAVYVGADLKWMLTIGSGSFVVTMS
jgi:hypothetical protein